eukprot:RCo034428
MACACGPTAPLLHTGSYTKHRPAPFSLPSRPPAPARPDGPRTPKVVRFPQHPMDSPGKSQDPTRRPLAHPGTPEVVILPAGPNGGRTLDDFHAASALSSLSAGLCVGICSAGTPLGVRTPTTRSVECACGIKPELPDLRPLLHALPNPVASVMVVAAAVVEAYAPAVVLSSARAMLAPLNTTVADLLRAAPQRWILEALGVVDRPMGTKTSNVKMSL